MFELTVNGFQVIKLVKEVDSVHQTDCTFEVVFITAQSSGSSEDFFHIKMDRPDRNFRQTGQSNSLFCHLCQSLNKGEL
mgnify:CR=1 FL=1